MYINLSNNNGVTCRINEWELMAVKKNEQKNQSSFQLDEQGAMEVNEQIMDSYNSGFIDQERLTEVEEDPQGKM